MATYSIEIRSSDGATVRESVSDYAPDPKRAILTKAYPAGLLSGLTPKRLRSMLAYELAYLKKDQEAAAYAQAAEETQERLAKDSN